MTEAYSWRLHNFQLSVISFLSGRTCEAYKCNSTVEHDVTVSDVVSRVLGVQGVWVAICVGTDTPKTEGDIPWMLWARVEDLSLGRNKATGAAIRARSTMGSGDLQLHEWVEAAMTQNWAWWKRRSCFCSLCADLSVWLLYLLYRKSEDKSPGWTTRLSQDIPTRHNRTN